MSIALALRLFIALLFARTAWHKWRNAAQFQAELSAYRLLPNSLVRSVAMLLTGLETACVILLIGLSNNSGVVVALLLLTLYTLAISINLARGHHEIDCGCSTSFSVKNTLSSWLLVRNLVLMLIAAGGLSNSNIASFTQSDYVLAGLVILTLILILESFEQALANSQRYRHWQRMHS